MRFVGVVGRHESCVWGARWSRPYIARYDAFKVRDAHAHRVTRPHEIDLARRLRPSTVLDHACSQHLHTPTTTQP